MNPLFRTITISVSAIGFMLLCAAPPGVDAARRRPAAEKQAAARSAAKEGKRAKQTTRKVRSVQKKKPTLAKQARRPAELKKGARQLVMLTVASSGRKVRLEEMVEKVALAVATPASSSSRILLIGDSHAAGVFGQTLAQLIKSYAPQARLTAAASCGSAPKWWLNGQQTRCGFWSLDANGAERKSMSAPTPLLADLLNAERPDLVIVELGANLIPQAPVDRHLDTAAFMSVLAGSGSRCIWIGPPDARRFSEREINEVYVLLRNLSKRHGCELVDSRKYTRYPAVGGDGIHYGGEEGERIASAWAENVFNQSIRHNMIAQAGGFQRPATLGTLAQADLPAQQIRLGQLIVQP